MMLSSTSLMNVVLLQRVKHMDVVDKTPAANEAFDHFLTDLRLKAQPCSVSVLKDSETRPNSIWWGRHEGQRKALVRHRADAGWCHRDLANSGAIPTTCQDICNIKGGVTTVAESAAAGVVKATR